jgi:hypothetical protein
MNEEIKIIIRRRRRMKKKEHRSDSYQLSSVKDCEESEDSTAINVAKRKGISRT